MKKEFVMRGQTASGLTETLNFGGHKEGYGYILTEFQVFPSTAIGSSTNYQLTGSITAAKEAQVSTDPNFNSEGLIANTMFQHHDGLWSISQAAVINDTFIITQDLILQVEDAGGANLPVNWQCRFKKVKMSLNEEAVTNFKQFTISDV